MLTGLGFGIFCITAQFQGFKPSLHNSLPYLGLTHYGRYVLNARMFRCEIDLRIKHALDF